MTVETDNKWHWAIGAVVLLILGVFAAIVILATDARRNHTNTITLLLGLTTTTVVALLALLKSMANSRELEQNTRTTDATAHTVTELANGSMDSKIRLAVAEVLAPQLVDPGARDQLEADAHKRDELEVLHRKLRARLDE